MKAFEIHTFQGGRWKIDSVFDDRELAVFEAQRMEGSRRYSGVRVVEETFDEGTQQTSTRTIYRGTVVESRVAPDQTATKPGVAKGGRAAPTGPTTPRPRRQTASASSTRSTGFLMAALGALVVFGVGAVVALRLVATNM